MLRRKATGYPQGFCALGTIEHLLVTSVNGFITCDHVSRAKNRKEDGKETHANNCRVFADVASLIGRLVDGEVFHLGGTEDDVCVGFCHRGDILIRWSGRNCALATLVCSGKVRKREIRRKATEESTWGLCALGQTSRSSFTSVVASSLRHVDEEK